MTFSGSHKKTRRLIKDGITRYQIAAPITMQANGDALPNAMQRHSVTPRDAKAFAGGTFIRNP